jgi:hypothetical protein
VPTQLGSPHLRFLSGLTSLRLLDLSYSDVTDLSALPALVPRLEVLTLASCHSLHHTSLISLLPSVDQQLQPGAVQPAGPSGGAGGAGAVTAAAVPSAGAWVGAEVQGSVNAGLPCLTELDVSYCALDSQTVAALLIHGTQLKVGLPDGIMLLGSQRGCMTFKQGCLSMHVLCRKGSLCMCTDSSCMLLILLGLFHAQSLAMDGCTGVTCAVWPALHQVAVAAAQAGSPWQPALQTLSLKSCKALRSLCLGLHPGQEPLKVRQQVTTEIINPKSVASLQRVSSSLLVLQSETRTLIAHLLTLSIRQPLPLLLPCPCCMLALRTGLQCTLYKVATGAPGVILCSTVFVPIAGACTDV